MIEPRSDRVQRALDGLRARGERVTPARAAVLEVLDGAAGHLDAEAVVARVARREPQVHRATVYRTLQSLTELGVLTHTHVPGAATIYHLDAGGEPRAHTHLQCTACRRFVDLPVSALDDLVQRVRRDTGFVIDARHAALLGTCEDCAQEADG